MTFTARLGAAPGTGLLARGTDFALFVPASEHARDLVDRVISAAPRRAADAIIDAVLDQPDETPPFVFVEWPTDSNGRLRVLARGDASLTSDLPSLPELSGAGSATWVEHVAPRIPASSRLRSGNDPVPGTDLHSGVVPAGGFELALATSASREENNDEDAPTAVADTAQTMHVSPVEPSAEPSAEPELEPAPAPASAPVAPTAIDAVLSAADANWMDESLQLDRAPAAPAPSAPSASEPSDERPPSFEQQPAPATTLSPTRPPGPPRFPGDSSAATEQRFPDDVDADVTLPGVAQRPDAPPSNRAVIRARMCPSGHSNPPEALQCRQCHQTIDIAGALTTVEQPALAEIHLPDGSRHPLSGATLLGRRPSSSDARLDATQRSVELIALEAPASVSRTHLVIDVDGWQLFATDCGSSGGTALIPAGEADLVSLEPWMAHELGSGDRLYLGGPTVVEIHDLPGLESSP